MKSRLSLLKVFAFIAGVVLMYQSFAQIPERMSYQAIIRNSSNEPVINQEVGLKISILQGSVSGNEVYVETHTSTTDKNGLLSIEIGSGKVISGDFSTIDWANGPFFLKNETDPEGGTSYSITGISQLLSVPYALYTKTADAVSGSINETDPEYSASLVAGISSNDTIHWNSKQNKLISGEGISIEENTISLTNIEGSAHYVGELFGGGIVFWVDPSGEHGLIASIDDLDGGSGAEWGLKDVDVVNCESMTDGAANTAAMIAAGAEDGTAAVLCDNYAGGGYSDWYLPSFRELYLLCSQDYIIDEILDNDDDENTNGLNQEFNLLAYYIPPDLPDYDRYVRYCSRYWSSTEDNYSGALSYFFFFDLDWVDQGLNATFLKRGTYRIRAVRAF